MTSLRGVVLAGGLGTRLRPMTEIVNKHALPVYDRPMVFYPLDALASAGTREVCIVIGGRDPDEIRELVNTNNSWDFDRIDYALQEGEGGIADALRCSRPYVDGHDICVILGDNVIEDSLEHVARKFGAGEDEAMVLLSEVHDPERFGVPRFDESGSIREIVEKPVDPPSSYAVVGIYFYRARVFDEIDSLAPSVRGELEITDLNNLFATRGSLGYATLDGFWADAGTPEGLFRASELVRASRAAGVPDREPQLG